MSSICLKDITKYYGEHCILHDFNLEIEQGEFISVIGSSGCGKTTVLKLMNGLLTPDKGSVYIDGKDISKEDQNDLRRHIGYVIQSIGLFPHMTIRENIAYVLNLTKQDHEVVDQRVKELMKIMRLDEDMMKRYPDELSGGQKQRVGIARALASAPSLLLMDEPFGAVDEITRHDLQDEILRIHEQLPITIFFITHDIQEALRLGQRVLVMKDGAIEQFDTPEHLIAAPATPFVKQLLSYR